MPPCGCIEIYLHRISWVEHYWNYIAIYCIEGLLQMGEGEQQQKDTERRYPPQIAERISGDGRTTVMQDTDTLIFTSGGLRRYRYLGCFDPTHIAKWGPGPLRLGS